MVLMHSRSSSMGKHNLSGIIEEMSSTKVVDGDVGQLEEQNAPILPVLLRSVPTPGPVRWVDHAQDQRVKLIPSQRLFSVTLQLDRHLLHGAAASGYPIVDLREEGSPRPHGRQLLVQQHDVVVPVQLHPRHQDLSPECKQQCVCQTVDAQERKWRLLFEESTSYKRFASAMDGFFVSGAP